jgi:hypothetical protein
MLHSVPNVNSTPPPAIEMVVQVERKSCMANAVVAKRVVSGNSPETYDAVSPIVK